MNNEFKYIFFIYYLKFQDSVFLAVYDIGLARSKATDLLQLFLAGCKEEKSKFTALSQSK